MYLTGKQVQLRKIIFVIISENYTPKQIMYYIHCGVLNPQGSYSTGKNRETFRFIPK